MELDGASGGLSLEVGGDVTKAEGRHFEVRDGLIQEDGMSRRERRLSSIMYLWACGDDRAFVSHDRYRLRMHCVLSKGLFRSSILQNEPRAHLMT
jgi:hypothetical protein